MINSLYPTFQHWSQNGSVWIISDTHFDDIDCKFMDKNWITPQEQVDIINSMVFKNDYLIHLGDVGNAEWVKKIKCKNRVLILGNHDVKSNYINCFEEIYTGALFIGEKILLSHEPIYGLNWCLNIHGHDHSLDSHYGIIINADGVFTINKNTHINLVANVCNYTPVNLGKLIKDGVLSHIDTIHRQTIDLAISKKDNEGW